MSAPIVARHHASEYVLICDIHITDRPRPQIACSHDNSLLCIQIVGSACGKIASK